MVEQIQESLDTLVPFYDFEISLEFRGLLGAELVNENLRNRAIAFEFTEEVNKADKVVISLDNNDLSLLDEQNIRVGNAIIFDFGYTSKDSIIAQRFGRRRHFITELRGGEILKLTALSADFYAMNQEDRTRSFFAFTVLEVAEFIANEYGFTRKFIHGFELRENIKIDSRTSLELLLDGTVKVGDRFISDRDDFHQKGETDWAFLIRLAKKGGMIFGVRDEIFAFAPSGSQLWPDALDRFDAASVAFQFSLRYKEFGNALTMIKKFKINHNILTAPDEIIAKGIDSTSKKQFEGCSNSDNLEASIDGPHTTIITRDSINFKKASPRKQVIPRVIMPIAGSSSSEAKGQTDVVSLKNRSKALTLITNLIGNPGIKVPNAITITGLGRRYSGRWRAFKSKHKIDLNGFNTVVEFDKSGMNEPTKKPIAKTKLPYGPIEKSTMASLLPGGFIPWTD